MSLRLCCSRLRDAAFVPLPPLLPLPPLPPVRTSTWKPSELAPVPRRAHGRNLPTLLRQGNVHASHAPPPEGDSKSAASASTPAVQTDAVAVSAARPFSSLPVHARVPFVGVALDVLLFNNSGLRLASRLGPVYLSELLGRRNVVWVCDVSAIRDVLRDARTFRSGDEAFPPTLARLFGSDIVFLQDGADHAASRAALMPALTSRRVEYAVPLVRSSARRMLCEMSASCTERKKPVLADAAKAHYLRVMISLTLSPAPDSGRMPTTDFDDPKRQRLAAVLQRDMRAILAAMPSPPFGPVFSRGRRARRSLEARLSALLAATAVSQRELIERLRAGDGRASDVDFLTACVAGSALPTGMSADALATQHAATLGRLARQLIALWFAGFASQAAATASCAAELLQPRRAALLAELRDELAAVGELTFDVLDKRMPLLDAVVNETLRLHPPTGTWFRRAASDSAICGFRVPKGSFLALELWAAQRDEQLFPDADVFRPERFLSGEADERHMIAFGALGGPHFCAGAALARVAIKETVATMVAEFDLHVAGGGREPLFWQFPEVMPRNGLVIESCERRDVRRSESRARTDGEI